MERSYVPSQATHRRRLLCTCLRVSRHQGAGRRRRRLWRLTLCRALAVLLNCPQGSWDAKTKAGGSTTSAVRTASRTGLGKVWLSLDSAHRALAWRYTLGKAFTSDGVGDSMKLLTEGISTGAGGMAVVDPGQNLASKIGPTSSTPSQHCPSSTTRPRLIKTSTRWPSGRSEGYSPISAKSLLTKRHHASSIHIDHRAQWDLQSLLSAMQVSRRESNRQRRDLRWGEPNDQSSRRSTPRLPSLD